MSYIHCLSNPESLYVWGGQDAYHHFSWFDRRGENRQFSIPSKDFDEFFRLFRIWEDGHDLWDEVFEYKGIQLTTVILDPELKRVLSDEEITQRKKRLFGEHGQVNHLLRLTYKTLPPLLMWEVTWDRLRNNVYEHLFRPCWFVRKINNWFGLLGQRNKTGNIFP